VFTQRPPLGVPAQSSASAEKSVDQQRRAETAANFKKAPPPQLGEAFGEVWRTDATIWNRALPGGGIVQFNLDNLTLDDYRAMKDHYQINASLSVLMFMMHQLDWKIVSDSDRVAKFCEENMREIWTRLVRAMSQAFWAGYSPNILQWENDVDGRAVKLTKIKDLTPEKCSVNWLEVEGWAPAGHVKPKLKVYDGIKQVGMNWAIPPENTLWYTLLKENDNWYGRKLLRPAFTPWYFSILVHMFANRYMERFGEPTPVGRAPMESVTLPDGSKTTGVAIMSQVLQNLRSRATVVLPDDRTLVGTDAEYDYQIEYLESQMRGADFERYLMRLDEEMSLGIFTPLLILRTADVGSYNLGTTHWNVFQQMLNALSGDWKEYIDRYVLGPMVNFNFGSKAKRAKILFRKLGDEKQQVALTMLQALIAGGKAKPNLEELGDIAGLTVEEVAEATRPDDDGGGESSGGDAGSGGAASGDEAVSANRSSSVASIRASIQTRVAAQLARARLAGDDSLRPDLGYQRQLADALGVAAADPDLGRAYAVAGSWLSEAYGAGVDDLETKFSELLGRQLEGLGNA
jgi:hypothetical protein